MKLRPSFLARIEKQPDGCWYLTGNRYPNGYARWNARLAHRVAYEAAHGPIPEGLLVCHRCDVKHCVNPAHLFLGTAKDNAQDMVNKGRAPKGGSSVPDYHAGESNPRAKLSREDAWSIMASAMMPHKLAAHYGVSVSTIGKIKAGLRWRSLYRKSVDIQG